MTDHPSTEVAVHASQAMTPADRYRYAQSLANAKQLPSILRGSVADVLLRVEYGVSVGIPPVSAISAIHVIDGKPTASAGLMSALVRKAGHAFRVWTEPDPAAPGEVIAVATITRADDPGFEYRSVWTVERAIVAKLLRRLPDGTLAAVKSGSAWDTYRAGMLKARATTEVCRDACEDVLLGVHYTAEEVGARTDSQGEPVLDGAVISDTAEAATSANPYEAPVPGEVNVGEPEPADAAAPVPGAPDGLVIPDGDVDALREALNRSESREEVKAVLVSAGLGNRLEDGRVTVNGDALKAITTANAAGAEMSAWDLVAELGASLPEKRPQDAPRATESGEPAAGAQPDPEPVLTPQNGAQEPADGIHDAEIVEETLGTLPAAAVHPPGCTVSGCVEPLSHTADGHLDWIAARRRETVTAEAAADLAGEKDPSDAGVTVPSDEPAPSGREAFRKARAATRAKTTRGEEDPWAAQDPAAEPSL